MRIPRATYRVQLHECFGFAEAAAICGYLKRLGVSELYVSPIFKAAPGSTHGYDVLDHEQLNPELGGESAFKLLVDELRRQDLGLLVDFVPNHMGVGCEGNRFWEDVLEHGQASARAEYFDIDWLPPKETLAHKLLLPILPEQYGVSLERGLMRLSYDGQAIRLRVGKRTLPLKPRSLGRVLTRVADLLEDQTADFGDELRDIAKDFERLSEGSPGDATARESYQRSARLLRHRLSEFLEFRQLTRDFVAALDNLSGNPEAPESFDFLDQVLNEQAYRLSAWRLALEAVNYRRFFDVTELASLRVELPEVFHATHRRLLSLVEEGVVTGIRLDHVDGLYDPIGYLRRLAENLHAALPGSDVTELPVQVIVEKILAPEETLPASFRAHGTTGYEFARVASGVFVDRRAEGKLTAIYRRFTGDTGDFADHLLVAKRAVLDSLLVAEATVLSRSLERVAEGNRRLRDLTWRSLHSALVEVMAAFPVYRSYVRPDGTRSTEDESAIARAISEALRQNPTTGRSAYQLLRSLLLFENAAPHAREFALRFQQTTGPVMAKGLEDTAFYRYTRNVCDNEVGGRPDRIGVTPEEFHAQNLDRQREHRLSLTATSTHDTKRGEDTRARLSLLSELPGTWRRTVFELSRIAARFRRQSEPHAEAPTRSDEYAYYQALVGIIPFGAGPSAVLGLEPRLRDYMLKACREAKAQTSWLHPSDSYESSLQSFIRESLREPAFVATILRFCARIERHAAAKSLGQVALKLCAPGVPDCYQGAEGWHQVLVDPDNRRPVDYAALDAQLEQLDRERADRRMLIPRLLENYADGAIKQFVVSELLRLRSDDPELFQGNYSELDAGAECIAFARSHAERSLVCVVPRFPFRLSRGRSRWPLGPVWGDARVRGPLLSGRYRDVFTHREHEAADSLRLAEVFESFPLAVLHRA